MVTGVEVAGLVLALLPFVAKSLTQYADGIETLSLFRTGRYSREYRRWAVTLDSHRVILLDNVTKYLTDVLEYDEDMVSEMKSNLQHPRWKDPIFDREMRKRLGDYYEPYKGNMMVLYESLSIMTARLGPAPRADSQGSRDDRLDFVEKLRMFKNIFSGNTYDKILINISEANLLLQKLSRISAEISEKKTIPSRSISSFLNLLAIVRRNATSLYNLLVREPKWTCQLDRHNHVINLRLDSIVQGHKSKYFQPSGTATTIALLTRNAATNYEERDSAQLAWHKYILEAEVTQVLPPKTFSQQIIYSHTTTSYSTRRRALASQAGHSENRHKNVSFAQVSHHEAERSEFTSIAQHDAPMKKDLCSAIRALGPVGADREYLGCLLDQYGRHHRCDFYVIRAFEKVIHPEPMRRVLATAKSQKNRFETPIFTRRDCLLMAVNLASNVLCLQDNWLPRDWSLEDVVLPGTSSPREASNMTGVFADSAADAPYLLCPMDKTVSTELGRSSLTLSEPSAMIRCPVLFPLGLVLVELALWTPLSAIPPQSEDFDLNPAVANLKKATRLLPLVAEQVSPRYQAVVEECLSWSSSRPQDLNLESEDFQRAVYRFIILPLENELQAWDGN